MADGFYAVMQEFKRDGSQRGLVASRSKEALVKWVNEVFLATSEAWFRSEKNCETVYVLYDRKTDEEFCTILVEWIGDDSIIGLNG